MAKMKTFKGPSMPDALAQVKREFGPDAVILGTRTTKGTGLNGLMGRTVVEITAGPPETASPAPRLRSTPTASRVTAAKSAPVSQLGGAPIPEVPGVPTALEPFYLKLVQNEVGNEIARRIVLEAAQAAGRSGRLNHAGVIEQMRHFIAARVPTTGGVKLEAGATKRVALVGPSGAGKTTTIAKLAANFKLRHGKSVAMLSVDMHRLAAHDQLNRYGEIIGVPVLTAQTPDEVRQRIAEIGNVDLLLIDTPGVGLREHDRFDAVANLIQAADVDEIHLVLPVSLSEKCQERLADVFRPLGVSRLVMTHLDDAVGFGVVLNVVGRLSCSLSYFTSGQKVPNDIEEACGDRFAELLLTAEG